ncbi:Glyco-Gag protein [Bienertia sinuspersici]
MTGTGTNRPNVDLNSRTEPNIVSIDMDDVANEINFWSSAMVCYVLGANLPLSVMTGFFEVGLEKELPNYITFQNEKGNLIQHPIEYEWRPTYCTNCKKYGHPVEKCNKRPAKKI